MVKNGTFGKRGVRTDGSQGPTPPRSRERSPLLLSLSLMLGVFGLAGGAWLGRQAIHHLLAYRTSVDLDRRMGDMATLARAKYPDLEPVEALTKYARQAAPEFVNSSASDRERAMRAAATFFGFYHVNTRSRVEHCAKLGVDLTLFANLIVGNHHRQYNRALTIVAASGTTEDQLWDAIRPQLAAMVTADMEAIARRTMTTPVGACQVLVNRADEFAGKLDFATLQPQIDGILMGS